MTVPEIVSENGPSAVFRMSERLWRIFSKHRVCFGPYNHKTMPQFTFMKDAVVEPYFGYMAGTRHICSVGALSYSQSAGMLFSSIGRYCSIANLVHTIGDRHPLEHVTTSSFAYGVEKTPFQWARNDLLGGSSQQVRPSILTKAPPVAEHDVWIGDRVTLQRGITLGTGCVIGAGAMVTKDVSPYAIVAGVPAAIIRMRFPEKIVERLLASQWWTRHPRVLFDLDIRDPERFLDGIAGAEAWRPAPLTFAGIMEGLANDGE
jgi:acetyltransferase-like isoleucine patch superfamily enzyme